MRDQAHQKRTRHLYALLWKSGRAYIGQSVNLHRRHSEHLTSWGEPFNMVHLGDCQGTYADAEQHELAWRHLAWQAGWVAIARNRENHTFVVPNPNPRMTPEHYRLAATLRWPRKHRRQGWTCPWWLEWLCWQGAALAGVVLMLRQPV